MQSKMVSIPFERESVFRQEKINLLESNGYVSIPFERESVFRLQLQGTIVYSVDICFNSLRAGKCVQTI